ncbi:hypothetical protein [Caballeronia grimmiae]|uniref:hypothetical protein n=1 Tax=Caballeronia grimmiae TaxID=1071679 RepID=UPI0038B861B5
MNRIQSGHLAVFFDEAGELPQSLKVATLRESVNLFKQLADQGRSNAILVSGPEFGPVLWESGQLAARVRLVPFDAYDFRVGADVRSFGKVLEKLEASLTQEFIEEGTLMSTNAKEMMRAVRGTIGVAIDIVVHTVHQALCAGEAKLTWARLKVAIDKRMKEIGSQIDREQALWEAVKDERLRSKHWGSEAAAGYLGKDLVLPSRPAYRAPAGGVCQGERGSGSATESETTSRRKRTGKGMHPTKPENVSLGEYSEETAEAEA